MQRADSDPGAALVAQLELALALAEAEREAARAELQACQQLIAELKSQNLRSELLANMSHEIRSPMNSVVGLAHLLRKTGLTPRQRDYVDKVQSAAQLLLGVIDNILDFSKAQAGKLTLNASEFDLDRLLHDTSSMIGQALAQKGLELVIDIDPLVPRALRGDPLRLGQILLNLADNAVKFTQQGEITIAVAQLSRGDDDAMLRFEVRDTGVGLTDDQIASLFTQGLPPVTGLGLAVSKSLAELMEGDVGVQSTPGRGSAFWFTARVGVRHQRKLAVAPDLRGCRALVVDDSFDARAAITDMLQSLTFDVSEAATGYEAIDAVRSADVEGQPFEIVYLDWRMPGIDGIDTANRIKSLGLQTPPTLVMISAYGREDVLKRAQACGIDTVLVKPVRASILYDASTDVLSKRRAVAVAGRKIPRAPETAVPPPGMASIRGARILLVEDNEINQMVAREILEDAGFIVEVANNGQIALDMVQQHGFDLVFMDMQMPVLDGVAATRKIRGIAGLAGLPIIAMTANAMEQDRQLCVDAGMNDALTKPIDLSALWASLVRWIPATEARTAGVASDAKAPSSEGVAWLNGVPGLDTVQGLAYALGNETLYRALLARFVTTQSGAPAQIHAALANGDLAGAEMLAHTVKSVAGNIGAEQVQQLGDDLEQALRTYSPPILVQDRLALLEHAMAALTDCLADRLQAEAEPAA